MNKTCLLLVLLIASPAIGDEHQLRLQWSREIDTSSLKEEELLAVPLDSDIYQKTQESLDDIAIQDSTGELIPFLIRKQKKESSHKVTKTWPAKNISLKPVKEVGLEIRFELNKDDPQLDGITILTPLKNFEQSVQVFAIDNSGTETNIVNDAVIFDYSRFMDVRNVRIPIARSPARRFLITIDQPTNQQQSQLFELTKTLRGNEELSQTIRKTIEERAFRIDGLQLWTDEIKTTYHVIDDHPYQLVETKISQDEETQDSVIDIFTNGEPLTEISIETPSRNFQRSSTLFQVGTHNGETEQLHQLASQSLKRFEFQQLQEEQLSLKFQPTRHRHLRLIIKNQDSPPLVFQKIQAYGNVDEVVFIAEANQKYSLLYGDETHQQERLDTAAIEAALSKNIPTVTVSTGSPLERDLTAIPPAPVDFRSLLNNPFLIGTIVLVMLSLLIRLLYTAAQKIEAVTENEANTDERERTS
ncbi:hypothetical protein [Thalassoglobus polymorphus]|uniref:DUF3999 domain-containing protein n=1 Tax=Thalassoglobus polymorphus TaxID=2527994 RepID=A0A517QJ05_9PLAN|nr:hypothetical protein [Thalassoglobus polymorphus]QDT31588.1 hypothetical protein Mal48_08230 [Thalassoglobus polymorphus]